MILSPRPPATRAGLSLLEVLAALAIFLMSFVAIGGLISLAADRALDVQNQTLAVQMCQTKLNEVFAGAIPLQSQSGTVEEDEAWSWSLEATQAESITGLWNVEVRVFREAVGGREYSVTMSAMVLDPAMRGNAADKPQVTGQEATASESTTPSTQSTQSSPTTPGGTSGGGSTGGGGGAGGGGGGGGGGGQDNQRRPGG